MKMQILKIVSAFFIWFVKNFFIHLYKKEMNYDIEIKNEPKEVTEIRHTILDTFKDLTFVEEGHHYFLNGEEIPSVSAVIHQFEEETNFDEIAESYAIKHGQTKEYWQRQWKYNNLKATKMGTRVHAFGESLGWFKNGQTQLICPEIEYQLDKENNFLVPIHPKEESIVRFMDDLPSSYHLVLNEAKVYSGLNPNKEMNPTHRYCGTFDMLYYYKHPTDDSKSGLIILDYKTNAELEKTFARSKGQFLKEPFNHMYSEPKSLYTLQLSAYQIPLEDIFPNIPILGRKLIWLKDDKTYEKIDLPDMTKTLRNIL